jgi:hypothetical protein
MKLSSTWFALILIVSALLLSAGLSVSVALPSPNPTKKSDAAAAHHHEKPQPIATLSNQPSPEPTAQSVSNYSYSYNYYRPSAESPPVWFQVLTTIALLAFTAGLWWTSVRQWLAIGRQADIAEKALASERPWISLYPNVLETEGAIGPRTTFSLKVRGRGPALVDEVRADLILREYGIGPPDSPSRDEYAKASKLKVLDRVIDSGEHSEYRVWIKREPSQRAFDPELIRHGHQELILFGIIRYTGGVAGVRHEHGFQWLYHPLRKGRFVMWDQYDTDIT